MQQYSKKNLINFYATKIKIFSFYDVKTKIKLKISQNLINI